MVKILLVGIFAGIAAIYRKQLKLIRMSKENYDALKGQVDQVVSSLTNIKDDITRIKENLPTDGGLTADEVATLRADLTAAVDKAVALDQENEVEGGESEA